MMKDKFIELYYRFISSNLIHTMRSQFTLLEWLVLVLVAFYIVGGVV